MAVSTLAAAQQALSEGKTPYARQLLEEVQTEEFPELERNKWCLLGRIPGADLQTVCGFLPSLDEELLLRAEAVLTQGDVSRAAELLSAAENREDPRWNLLQGNVLVLQRQYVQAAEILKKAEKGYPKECWPLLETCFRELGDFQQAYLYACRQK